MKLEVTFKTPDAVELDEPDINASEQEWDEYTKMVALINQYVQYGEYVTIVFDTETRTAKVL